MLNLLPNVRIRGEFSRQQFCTPMAKIFAKFDNDNNGTSKSSNGGNHHQQFQHHEYPENHLMCAAQTFIEELVPPPDTTTPDDPSIVIGFKEIRLDVSKNQIFNLNHFYL